VTGATGPTGVNVLNTAGTNSILGHVVQGTGRGTILSGGAAFSSASDRDGMLVLKTQIEHRFGKVFLNKRVFSFGDSEEFACIGE
jgi:hypothetical protein